jgi:hypothetical protein
MFKIFYFHFLQQRIIYNLYISIKTIIFTEIPTLDAHLIMFGTCSGASLSRVSRVFSNVWALLCSLFKAWTHSLKRKCKIITDNICIYLQVVQINIYNESPQTCNDKCAYLHCRVQYISSSIHGWVKSNIMVHLGSQYNVFKSGADPGFQVRGGRTWKNCTKRRKARIFLGYFVWKITILRQKIIFFPI